MPFNERIEKCFRVARYSASLPPERPKRLRERLPEDICKPTQSVTQDSAKPMFEMLSWRNHLGAFSEDLPTPAFQHVEGFLVIFSSQLNGKEGARVNQIFDGVPEDFKGLSLSPGRPPSIKF